MSAALGDLLLCLTCVMFILVIFLAVTLFKGPYVVSSGNMLAKITVEWTILGTAHSVKGLVGSETGRP